MLIERRHNMMESDDAIQDWSDMTRVLINTLQNKYSSSLTSALEKLHAAENREIVQDMTQLAALPMHYQVSSCFCTGMNEGVPIT